MIIFCVVYLYSTFILKSRSSSKFVIKNANWLTNEKWSIQLHPKIMYCYDYYYCYFSWKKMNFDIFSVIITIWPLEVKVTITINLTKFIILTKCNLKNNSITFTIMICYNWSIDKQLHQITEFHYELNMTIMKIYYNLIAWRTRIVVWIHKTVDFQLG